MSNRPEAGERSGLVEAETEGRQRSAVSNRAVTRGDVMPSVETLSCQNPAGKQDSCESECRPPSSGRVTTAFAATVLVVMVIVAVIPLGIDAARNIDFPVMVKPLTLGDGKAIAAITIFAGTYLVIAIGKLPGYRLDRAGAALLGASLMAAVGVVSLDQAYRAIDFDTITLLLGMMIVVANLRLSGFFRLVNNWVVTRARHPFILLTAIVMVAGSFSAFLVNDTVCLAVTPLVLGLATRLKRDPVPYLLAIPLASNVGSTATITGNPQNMIIGGLSHIPYGTFAATLWPVAAVGLILTVLLIALIYRSEFLSRERFPAVVGSAPRYHRPLVIKSVLVTLAMVILFFAGQPVAKVAITGGALLLLTRKLKPGKVYHEIDWPLLLMFVGLFIVVTGLETACCHRS